jgi:hypothetical protein
MTQVRRDAQFKAAFGRRLTELVDRELNLSWGDLASRLGYANSTTVRQAARGQVLLSAEKLALLAQVTDLRSRRVSIDWLLTGTGTALLGDREVPPPSVAQRVARAPRDIQAKISGFLDVVTPEN